MALFKIFKDKTGQYRFLLKSNKYQIIFTSKGYSSRVICFSQIQLIKRYALKDEIYERQITHSNSPYFTFKVFKNEVIGISENFLNQRTMEKIIALIKTNALKAEIDKTTYSMSKLFGRSRENRSGFPL